MIERDDIAQKNIAIKVKILGIGGAGSNAVEMLLHSNINHVETYVLNTDIQALQKNKTQNKIQLGTKSVLGFGTGANPDVGKIAAEENIDEIISLVEDAQIVFLIGGLGGGTGSGVMPVIAKILQEKNILSIALVTKPFIFEGSKRMIVANQALLKLEELVDTLIVIPNQKLFETDQSKNLSLMDAFNSVNEVMCDCIKTVVDTIHNPGHINVDFADIKTTLSKMGKAVMGIGKGIGEKRAEDAIKKAISSQLLEHTSLKGAKSILLNVVGNESLSLNEMSTIANYIHDQAHQDANIIVGSSVNSDLEDEIHVTLIATGFEDSQRKNSFKANPSITRDIKTPQLGFYDNTIMQKDGLNKNSNQEKNLDDLEIPALLRKLMQEHQNLKS